jgi:cytoskeletal protein RodZ
MNTAKEIGNIFREAREKKGLTAEDVYQKTKIHLRVIGDIEAGAFDRLAPLYMKSFFRKYAGLLDLDADALLEQFESSSRKGSSRPFTLSQEAKKAKPAKKDKEEKKPEKKPEARPVKPEKIKPEKKEKVERKGPIVTRQQVQTLAVAALSVVLVALVFVLANMVRSWRPFGRTLAGVTTIAEEKGTVKGAKVAADQKAGAQAKTEELASSPVKLTLKATGKSWVQVKEGDKNLFASIMEKGDTHSWKADGTLTVQTGKAENLEFTVNKKSLGTIAAGVVKNIKVSGAGVKIGEKVIPLR